MIIEFAKNVLGLKDANSTEFDLETSNPVIDIIESQKGLQNGWNYEGWEVPMLLVQSH